MNVDFNKYKDAFFSEAKALIKTMNSALMELEKNPQHKKAFHEIFYAAHTLKSLAATMRFHQCMNLCHSMEDLLEFVRNNGIEISKCSDLLFKCFDYLNNNINEIETHEVELNLQPLIEELKLLIMNGFYVDDKNNQLETQSIATQFEKIKVIEVKVERMDVLINLAEELLISKMKLDTIGENIEHAELSATIEFLGRLITELQYHVMQIRLVPVGFVFERFRRMARDLAKQQKKKINFEIIGADIEIDRLLIDEISESIAHLIRNAIDHGLETPDIRQQMNKPVQATIQLSATRSKEVVTIEIKDDGAGLDLSLIKKMAIEHGYLNSKANDVEVTDVIFTGFSTKKVPTKISGRGLGLAIVKQKIESVGGNIHVASILHEGTNFIIELPLSIAIIHTLFVMVAGETFAIPIEFVDRLLVVEANNFKGLINNEAVISGDTNIPVIRLSDLFHKKVKTLAKQPVVVIRKGDERIGLVVDSLLSTEEVVIKSLSRAVKNNRYFTGAALVGSGKMVLILDILYLLQSRIKAQSVEKI